MRTEYIRKNDQIDTISGYLVIKGSNGSGLIYADEYEAAEDGTAVIAGHRALTENEIGRLMKEADGQNHCVRWTDRSQYRVREGYGDRFYGSADSSYVEDCQENGIPVEDIEALSREWGADEVAEMLEEI